MKIVSKKTESECIFVPQDSNERLDLYLANEFEGYSRSFVQRLIHSGCITVNGKPAKAKYKPKKDDRIDIEFPGIENISLAPENIPIDILYQDECLAVLNKAAGIVVHPAPGNYSGTLVNGLLYHIRDLSGIGGKLRPGIVHRLDKDTTGLMVVAKNDKAHISLSGQIRERTAGRVYWALACGNIRADAFTVEAPIARHKTDRKKMAADPKGRPAATHFKVLKRYGGYTFLEAELETGRTHQIRVHLKHYGNPVCGDPLYGRKKEKFNAGRQLLHAGKLQFIHPETHEKMCFETSLPDDFQRIMNSLDIDGE